MSVTFDFQLPFTLRSYYIYEKISKGGYGLVFKALSNKYPDREFAIKFQDLSEPRSLETYNNEVNALMNLSHPNIVLMYDYGRYGQYGYVVLEYCESNLKNILLGKDEDIVNAMNFDKSDPFQFSVYIFSQVIAAVSNMHYNTFVHRDIKPENILITKAGRIKLADFGLAVQLKENERLNKFAGTLIYCAPEATDGVPYDGFAADIWATGVVFFQCIQGLNLPWNAESLIKVKDLVGYGVVDLPSSVPRKIAHIINSMMASNPKNRPKAEILERLFPQKKLSKASNNSLIFRSLGVVSKKRIPLRKVSYLKSFV